MPVAIHCEPVSEPHSRTRPSEHDGLPRRTLVLLAMTEPWSQGEAGSSQAEICK